MPVKYTLPKDAKLLKKHYEYAKELFELEQKRQATIESKLAQLIGQASIVVSITSLFIPLFIGKIKGVSLFIIFILLFIFLFVLFFYCLTIYFAINTLYIKQYKYVKGSISTITRDNRANNEWAMMVEQVEDYVYAIPRNTKVNNKKGTSLNWAAKSFKIANIGLGVFAFLLALVSVDVHEQKAKDSVHVKLKHLNQKVDSLMKIVQKNSKQK